LVAENVTVVGSSLSGVSIAIRGLSQHILSVELAGGGIAVETRVVLGGGASQEDAKDLHQQKVGIFKSITSFCLWV
jgi:hypothetical protein